ncbi:MAG: tRNA lysidine(34) synthetase TilS [Alphaproteobacteria bacterium]|nr:tRNA lysidine(34) synthetase TilS [Alphaproteobacteria bacterium]
MAAVGPFEPRPRLAVAVSGGVDSVALCLLADQWARRRGGGVVALTVDHRLRPESLGEARQVGAWLSPRGIPHKILSWTSDSPGSGIQAAARSARYRLLSEWCARNGVFHLLLAHHLEDQAETFLMRLARGSGVDGLAAMAPVSALPHTRLLRPLLGVTKSDLMAVLQDRSQDWIEDPSNQDHSYHRVRVRAERDRLDGLGMTARRLAETCRRMADARALLEELTTSLMARAISIHAAGYANLDRGVFTAAPSEIGRRALVRTLTTIGATSYGPRADNVSALYHDLAMGRVGRPRTLGGCRLVPTRSSLLICREPAAAKEEIELGGRGEVVWDRRYRLKLTPDLGTRVRGTKLRRLGVKGWTQAVADRPDLRPNAIPNPAIPSLPAIFDAGGVVAVPHLGYGRHGSELGKLLLSKIDYEPMRPLSAARFSVALWGERPISS